MPAAMAFAVVATANHWILDVIAGGTVTLAALAVERRRPHRLDRWLRRALVDGLFEPRRNPTIDLEPVVEDRALHSRQQHR
jgi:hypothetical protein